MNEVEIKFTPEERDLIIDHTFTGPDLTKRLQIAEVKGKHLITKYSTYDLEELIGYIAAEANQCGLNRGVLLEAVPLLQQHRSQGEKQA